MLSFQHINLDTTAGFSSLVDREDRDNEVDALQACSNSDEELGEARGPGAHRRHLGPVEFRAVGAVVGVCCLALVIGLRSGVMEDVRRPLLRASMPALPPLVSLLDVDCSWIEGDDCQNTDVWACQCRQWNRWGPCSPCDMVTNRSTCTRECCGACLPTATETNTTTSITTTSSSTSATGTHSETHTRSSTATVTTTSKTSTTTASSSSSSSRTLTSTTTFDCYHELDVIESAWSATKREWCCEAVDTGCAPNSTANGTVGSGEELRYKQ